MENAKIWRPLTDSKFASELLEKILERYQEEMKEIGYTICEEERDNAKAVFEQVDGVFKERLEELETLRTEQMKASMIAGIQYGLFCGFKQFFVKKYVGHPFEEFFERTIRPVPCGTQCILLAERRQAANELAESMEAELNTFSRECLTSIETAADERDFGVMRYAFVLGYHAAHEIICEVETPGSLLRVAEKIWRTEEELGFNSDISVRWS